MRVAVVGGGPLGQFFALHLAWAGAEISLVTRDVDAAELRVFRSRAMPFGSERETQLRVVSALTEVDAVIVAVRAEQVPSVLAQVAVAGPKVALVFTPLMSDELVELRERFPDARVGMPVLAAEVYQDSLRYWQAPSTLVESFDLEHDIHLKELVRLLRLGGVWVRVLPDVAARSSATTAAFFPLHLAIHACPHLTQWGDHPSLVADLAQAMQSSRRLATRMGKVEPGVAALAWWMSKAWRIRYAAALMPRFAPALTHFLEQHFGTKLGLQHVKLAREISATARRLGQPSPVPPSLTRSLPMAQISVTDASTSERAEGQ